MALVILTVTTVCYGVNTVYSYCQLNMSVPNPYSGLPVIHGFVIITVATLRYDVNAVFSYGQHN